MSAAPIVLRVVHHSGGIEYIGPYETRGRGDDAKLRAMALRKALGIRTIAVMPLPWHISLTSLSKPI